MTIEITILVLIFSFSLAYLLWPFLRPEEVIPRRHAEIDQGNLSAQKETLLASIKDLELDHSLKKVSDEDFKELYNDALLDGAGLIKRIEKGCS